MKATIILLPCLISFIVLSCTTTQPRGGAKIIGTQRVNLNGFGEITGRVVDPELKALLPGVNVLVLNTKLGAATDHSGTFRISNVPPGLYTIKVSFIGYTSVEVQVRVIKNQVSVFDFDLIPEPYNSLIHLEVTKR